MNLRSYGWFTEGGIGSLIPKVFLLSRLSFWVLFHPRHHPASLNQADQAENDKQKGAESENVAGEFRSFQIEFTPVILIISVESEYWQRAWLYERNWLS